MLSFRISRFIDNNARVSNRFAHARIIVTAVASENKLQSPQNLPGIERRGEAERFTGSKITFPKAGEAHSALIVIRRERGNLPSGWIDRDRYYLAHGGEIRAIEKIRGLDAEIYPRGAVLLEAERFCEPQVDAAEVRPYAGVAPDIKETIR